MATFTGTAGVDAANAPGGVLTGFSGGSLVELQDAMGDSFSGLNGADTIVAGIGDDTITGGLGTDSIEGGEGNDTIRIVGGDFSGAEVIAGGLGTGDLLDASGVINFDNGLATLTGLETLLVNGANPNLTFSADQFQNFTSVQETATGVVEVHINVSVSFSLAPLGVSGWGAGNRLWLDGSGAGNALTGNDALTTYFAGNGGADTLVGGTASDYFYYYAGTDIVAGEVLDGGSGNSSNYLQLAGQLGTVYDFNSVTISNINVIDFSQGGGGTAFMPASLFVGFAGGIAQIFGSYGADTVSTTGSQVDMRSIQFYFDPPGFIGNWDAVMDRIIINGTAGQDTLTGTVTADSIYGYAGDDRINAYFGADYADGGDGFDIISYSAAGLAGLTFNLNTGVHTGEAANDTLVGFEGVSGTGNADDLTGNDAANRLEGQSGADTLTGLGGSDALVGGYGDDSLIGGDGLDVFEATHELDGADIMRGGSGFDIVTYAAIISNNPINVTLNGNTQVTVGIGGGNSDFLIGIEGVIGAAGADALTGDGLANLFRGMGANDILQGLGGNDSLEGSDGNDSLYGGDNDDLGLGGSGTDYLDGQGENDALYGGDNNDTVVGNIGDDYLDGQGEDDELYGNDGRDILVGRLGNDYLDGGDGRDELYGNDNDDILLGNLGDDYLDGQGEIDILYGNAGRDTLYGNAGNDQIWGGTEVDLLIGGTGDDQFRFQLADLQVGVRDVIADFAEAGGNADLLVFFGVAAGAVTTAAAGGGTSVSIAIAGGTAEILLQGFTPAQLADQMFFL